MKMFRRKKYLINKKFQFRFAAFFLFEAIVVLMLSLGFIYHLHCKYSDQMYRLEYDNRMFALLINSFVGTDLAAPQAQDFPVNEILVESIFFAVCLFAIVLIPSIIASHRIAGPLYKLNRMIKDVSRGMSIQKISFRKRDSFKEMESNFNDMLASLHYRKSVDLQDIDNLIQKIIFMIKKHQGNRDIGLSAHEIRDLLLKMKKRKKYNE